MMLKAYFRQTERSKYKVLSKRARLQLWGEEVDNSSGSWALVNPFMPVAAKTS